MFFFLVLSWSIFILFTSYLSVYLKKPVEPLCLFFWVIAWVIAILPQAYKISFGG